MQAKFWAGVAAIVVSALTKPAGAQAPSAVFPAEPPPPTTPAEAPATGSLTTTAEPSAPSKANVAPLASARATQTLQPQPQPAPPGQPPPPPARQTARYNLGAGLLFGDSILGVSGLNAPTYHAALELRLGRRAWLALNGRFTYESRESAPLGADTLVATRVNTTTTAGLLGIRYIFVQHLVDVAFFTGAFAAYQHVSGSQLQASGATGLFSNAPDRYIGLLAGLAVERELIDALALRLSLDLGGGYLGRSRAVQLDANGVEQHLDLNSARVELSLRPGLQLHFYF